MAPFNWDFFDQILYINLEESTDRKTRLLHQLEQQKVPMKMVTRIDAVRSINGARGCTLSHIKALQIAKNQGYKHTLILEDDLQFLASPQQTEKYIQNFKEFAVVNSWDVFFLGTQLQVYEQTKYPQILRVLASYFCHAYCISNHYIATLQHAFSLSYKWMKYSQNPVNYHMFTIDRMWQCLQLKDRWYVGKKVITRQAAGCSSIQHDFVERKPKVPK